MNTSPIFLSLSLSLPLTQPFLSPLLPEHTHFSHHVMAYWEDAYNCTIVSNQYC